jgi:transcriptional regulator with XRE-family HTH domain
MRARTTPATDRISALATRLATEIGLEIREERRRRRLSLRQLADGAGLSREAIRRLEAGAAGSVEAYARVAAALAHRPELHLVDPRGRPLRRTEDPAHSWMGDVEAARFQGFGLGTSLDEPFQHYQFAGRADLIAWSLERRALLHVENRTQFPNLQEAAGSYNAKRAYLAAAVADRLKVRGGFVSVGHVMVCLRSADVVHTLRLRTASFRALCPDGADAFEAWWIGDPPRASVTSSLVVLDPLERPRSRRWVDFAGALTARPRYSGYADAVAKMQVAIRG